MWSTKRVSSTTLMLVVLFLTSDSCSCRGGLIWQTDGSSKSCPSSSCGNIPDIRFPFRLKTSPTFCGYNLNTPVAAYFVLDCHHNNTILTVNSRRFYVKQINYERLWIWLIDLHMARERRNYSSCVIYSNGYVNLPVNISRGIFLDINMPVISVSCLTPVNSSQYIRAPFCGNPISMFAAAEFYSYVMVGNFKVSDLAESCSVSRLAWALKNLLWDKSSLESIYDGLTGGFKLSWFPALCEACITHHRHCSNMVNKHSCNDINVISYPSSYVHFWKKYWDFNIIPSTGIQGILPYIIILKFPVGFLLLVCLVVYKWRRRHSSFDKTIEEFLQVHHNLALVKYTYSDIKKMTRRFNERLGEGTHGKVYKGKVRSGLHVAVKMMELSPEVEEQFINEVGTIGNIHHCNVVQLVGFCAEGSKYALVYEYLSNGSLDRYIFNQQSLGVPVLGNKKMFEIILGVARGINYLHHGCNMRILHFDLKPHNILLDDRFNPKISDFGLAQLHATNESDINLIGVRGTIGYMAPEMFYRNLGGISFKADVYSFGMMLMEMTSRRKNRNPFAEDINQVYFPSWAYDQLCNGNDVVFEGTMEERNMIKRVIMVALWCIQMRPSDRPPMGKVVEMLEGEYELRMPPKPLFLSSEISRDQSITRTYSMEYLSVYSCDD